jgi:hypothetical protein
MLDPSYLRSIRDGIITGNIEANNNVALPDGLVGLYDQELFPPSMKWKERKETLQLFLVFALAQKEISADFAAQVLGDMWYNLSNENTSKEEKRLQRVNDLIQLHSKRFGSAGGGKYRLYHERFRVYVLQKVSQQDITQFNDKFISLCETALETISEKDIPEKESYALEFISTHFFISAMQGETECLNKDQATALKKYAYDQRFWERQVKASKGFEWSKHMLNQMMSWASKFNEEDEVIECALSKVDLYHQEQNDAPRIVQLVADGDLETALDRIEKFGGGDKEGLQRKFILYMLCLMELTLLDSKDKNHAKTSIEKLLKHFDQNIPAYQPDLINWNDFFPSYLVLFIAIENIKNNVNVESIFKRTNRFGFNKIILNNANYREFIKHYQFLVKHIDEKEDDLMNTFITMMLSFKVDDEMIELLLNKFPNKNDYIFREVLLIKIKSNSIKKSEGLFDKIRGVHSRFFVINNILSELKKSPFKPFFILLNNLFNKFDYSILDNDELKCKYWHFKALYLHLQNKIDSARVALNSSLKFLPTINSKNIDYLRSHLIPEVYCLIGKEKALQLLNDISSSFVKVKASENIVRSICMDGETDEAHKICLLFDNPFERAMLYPTISQYELLNKGFIPGIKTIKLIPRESRDASITNVIRFLLEKNRTDYAIELCNEIYFEEDKCEAYMYICEFYLAKNELKEFFFFKEKIKTNHVILDFFIRSRNLIGKEQFRNLGLDNDFAAFCDDKEISKHKNSFTKYQNYLYQNGLFNELAVLFENSLSMNKNDSNSFSKALNSLMKMYSEDHEKLLKILNYIDTKKLSNEIMILSNVKASIQSGKIEKVEELRLFIKEPIHQLEFDCYWIYGILNSGVDFESNIPLNKIHNLLSDYHKMKKSLNSYDWALAAKYYHSKSDEIMTNYFAPLLIRLTVSDSILVYIEKNNDSNLRFDVLSKFYILNGILGYDWDSESAVTLKEIIRKACDNSEISSKIRMLLNPIEKLKKNNSQTISTDKLKESNFSNQSSLELLQLYCLNHLIFDNFNYDQIKRFNSSLNIKWAIDIKNQLPN